MAHTGKELVNPQNGQKLVFRLTSDDTAGELLEMEGFYPPEVDEPVPHYHPRQDERFEILAGTMAARLDGKERVVRAGETLDVPSGTVHAMWNAGDEEARLIWQTRPALRTERFFETYFGLARDGKTNSKGIPNLLQLSLLVPEFDDEVRLAKPPRPLQKVIFGALAPLAKARGYRGWYPQYGDPPPAP
jgi:mannose-6-phosphate isomerase-like protein (cupin superfamily)